MAQHRGRQLLAQNVVFKPDSAGISPSDIELGKMTKGFLPIRKKGKDTTIKAYNLLAGRIAHELPAEALDLNRGTLSIDGSAFAWIKSRTLTGSVLKIVSASKSAEKSKSVSFNVGSDATCNWYINYPAKGPYNPILFITDPYKRMVYSWKLADISKSPPQKLFPWSSPFPEGSVAKPMGGIQHSSDGSYFALTEWMQWPAIKARAPGFWAGIARIYEVSTNDYRDVWAQACAFADKTMRLFVFAERLNPGQPMYLHITEPSFEVQFHGIKVEIPSTNPVEVPRHIHVFESARLVGVITTMGLIHVFDLRSGDHVHSEPITGYPTNGDVDFAIGDDNGKILLVRTGQSVVKVELS